MTYTNPLFRYDCHFNTEAPVSLGSFKYCFKYVNKGPDCISIGISHRDEITRYLTGRYVSASEAIWRTFHFEMHELVPPVVCLQIHLPGQHMVIFDPNESLESIMACSATERTTLTAFFDANNATSPLHEVARQYTYQDFPQNFVWNATQKQWTLRQRGRLALGRMYFVPPTAGERFYLRTLLSVVRGPTSFLDLRTYNGIVHPTFEAACLARGLLEDDGEWHQCLQEACEMQTGTQLRQLFVTLLSFCEPSRPADLWEEFHMSICDDLHHKLQTLGIRNPSEDEVYDYGLHLINKLLLQVGLSLEHWPSMPISVIDWDHRIINPLIAEQLDYDHEEEQALALKDIFGSTMTSDWHTTQ